MGPRAGMDRRGNYRPPPGFDPGTVQPIASRYTDCATGPIKIYSASHKMYFVILYLKNLKLWLKSLWQYINICWFLQFIMYVGDICPPYPAVFGSVLVWRC